MYGLVNKSIQGLLRRDYGEESWQAVKARAGLDSDTFIGNQAYPDQLTYALVAAAAEVLGLPAAQVLEAFGGYWIEEIGARQYSHMMAASGQCLADFLRVLPTFHARIQLVLPDLAPPTFEVSDETDHSLHLHYRSHRRGLQPFVVGLLRGLAVHFGTPATVTTVASIDDGHDHDVFQVTWG